MTKSKLEIEARREYNEILDSIDEVYDKARKIAFSMFYKRLKEIKERKKEGD